MLAAGFASMGTPARAGKRLGDAAPRRLDGRLQRLARAARAFARLSEERQHKLRIEAKRLRYALEMLRGVLPRRPWRADQRALARFQRATGAVRDSAQAQALVERLTRSAALRAACGRWARTQAQRHHFVALIATLVRQALPHELLRGGCLRGADADLDDMLGAERVLGAGGKAANEHHAFARP